MWMKFLRRKSVRTTPRGTGVAVGASQDHTCGLAVAAGEVAVIASLGLVSGPVASPTRRATTVGDTSLLDEGARWTTSARVY
ncbi:hypothetical protein PC128_g25893 [Phytophthora cactorum]|nr:hypothetical protein PC128_g25893 [Phytophthora cactorum]